MFLGLISISFLNYNLSWYSEQLNIIFLFIIFYSLFKLIILGSSSDNSKSSGIGYFFILFILLFGDITIY